MVGRIAAGGIEESKGTASTRRLAQRLLWRPALWTKFSK
jgi:hypothetical protein